MGRDLRRRLERAPTNFMNLRHFTFAFFVLFGAFAIGQTPQLEKPAEPARAPAATQPATTAPDSTPKPAAAPVSTPAPAPMPMPPPPEPPAAKNPLGLLILGVILAHVCLPLGVIIALILVLILARVFKGALMKLAMGAAAAGGFARIIKAVLVTLGFLIVLPSGFLGLNWASKWTDHRVYGATYWIYGLVVAVVTGFVFFALMKAVGRALKKQLAGRLGGMGGMMGGMGGMGGFGGFPGMNGDQRELRGKPRGGKKRR